MSRAFFVPEVIQTSAMDCGPAVLASMLAGHGVKAAYARLRDACQTSVDGTSIDAIESVAVALGLDAEQVLVPTDHVLLAEAALLPAIAVVANPEGLTHFVVLWRCVGPLVEVMDPALGRRWMTRRAVRDSLYVHAMPVPAAAWREFAGTADNVVPLRARVRAVGGAASMALLDRALADERWEPLASLDAATRLAADLVASGALSAGVAAKALSAWVVAEGKGERALPESCRSVGLAEADEDGPRVELRGAVLVRVRGVAATAADTASADLRAALVEPAPRPWRALAEVLAEDGVIRPAYVGLGLSVATLSTLASALVARIWLDAPWALLAVEQRLAAAAVVLVLGAARVAADFGVEREVARIGRRADVRLRARLAARLAELDDRYFRSRPATDLAERVHALQGLRAATVAATEIARGLFATLLTGVALALVVPWSAVVVVPAIVLLIGVPLLALPALAELDLKRRTHHGASVSLYLDVLLGGMAVRTHAAERALARRYHERLGAWVEAAVTAEGSAVAVNTVQGVFGALFAVAVLVLAVGTTGSTPAALLAAWWAFALPASAARVAVGVQQIPLLRSVLLRVLEPLAGEGSDPVAVRSGEGAAAVRFDAAVIEIGGRRVLDGVSLDVAPGEHVAIVGASGAGKSSLLGVLLGWFPPAEGSVIVDGAPLDAARVADLRRRIAWIDPEVQLWNQTLLDNLRFGNEDVSVDEISAAAEAADLRGVMASLPDGLQEMLGEGGRRLSTGQAQRVRIARALARKGVDLVLLDEAFRGLDRDHRERLMDVVRQRFRGVTLLCVTHDIDQAAGFPRVIVLESGRVVEDGHPRTLMSQSGAFAALVKADHDVRTRAWADPRWRRATVRDGVWTTSDRAPSERRSGQVTPHGAVVSSPLAWPAERSGEALGMLLGTGVGRARGVDAVRAAAATHGVDLVEVPVPWPDRVDALVRGAPALLLTAGGAIAVARGAAAGRVDVLLPDGSTRRVDAETVLDAAFPAAGKDTGAWFEGLGLTERAGARVLRALRDRALRQQRARGLYLLRPATYAGAWATIADLGLARRAMALVAWLAVYYALIAAMWALLYEGAFGGTVEGGWLAGFALTYAASVVVRAWFGVKSVALMARAAVALRSHLFAGALAIDGDRVRREGVGGALGQVFESEVLEGAALSSLLFAGLALADVAFGLVLLGAGASWLPFAGVVICLTLGAHRARRFWHAHRAWTTRRLALTARGIEQLTGRRTTAAQQRPSLGRAQDDEALAAYLRDAEGRDLAVVDFGVTLRGGLEGAALFGVAATQVVAPSDLASVASMVGGALFVARGFESLAGAFVSAVAAATAREQLGPMLEAAVQRPLIGDASVIDTETGGSAPIDAEAVSYRYAGASRDALRSVSLRIEEGDLWVVEGPSGGGKSTLVSMLAGLRSPSSGLLLLHGLDGKTWGAEGWRRRVVAAPAFHENRVFHGTLAFNLLLGRRDAPTEEAVAEARQVCVELGLWPLIERMPSGLSQIVGEAGWQLSHGERSRVFLARALLQGASVVVLDETLGALDPENLRLALDCAARRARSLVVIAHP